MCTPGAVGMHPWGHCVVTLGSLGEAVVIGDVSEDGRRAKVTPSGSLKVLAHHPGTISTLLKGM